MITCSWKTYSNIDCLDIKDNKNIVCGHIYLTKHYETNIFLSISHSCYKNFYLGTEFIIEYKDIHTDMQSAKEEALRLFNLFKKIYKMKVYL